jgi:hypothetical protein
VKKLMTLICCLFASCSYAGEIASCQSPAGRAYYFNLGIVPDAKSGWENDKISNGSFTLVKSGQELDILFVDVTKKVQSSKANGALVKLLRIGDSNFTVLVYYENDTIELYTFARENNGRQTMHLMQSKGGDALVQKSSVLIARCDSIDFQALRN